MEGGDDLPTSRDMRCADSSKLVTAVTTIGHSMPVDAADCVWGAPVRSPCGSMPTAARGCEAFYRRSLADISALFDMAYISFYKQLGGLAGAALTGPEDVVAEAKEWRRRHGGMLHGLWAERGFRAGWVAHETAADAGLPGSSEDR